MPIPTIKQLADRKRSAKARKVMLANKEAKRIAEGREPDTREDRARRKLENAPHHKGVKHIRTEVQKQTRVSDEKIKQLLNDITVLQVIDSENLLDVITQDRKKDEGKEPIDLLKALDLRAQGTSLVKICQECNTTQGKLRGLFKRYDAAHGKVLSYKGCRADILADMQRRILKSISDSDIKATTVGARLKALCQLYDKERLERDLSTANVLSIHDDIAAIKAAQPARPRHQAIPSVHLVKEQCTPKALPAPLRPGPATEPD